MDEFWKEEEEPRLLAAEEALAMGLGPGRGLGATKEEVFLMGFLRGSGEAERMSGEEEGERSRASACSAAAAEMSTVSHGSARR